jgi:8-oxo-dGTP diphosphatase
MGWVYAVAFVGDRFAMVYNEKREGWEMPGGRMEEGESPEEAMMREFREESGFFFQPLASVPRRDGWVFAGRLGCPCGWGEMRMELFSELPEKLSFGLDEYIDVVSWATKVMAEARGSGSDFPSNLIY